MRWISRGALSVVLLSQQPFGCVKPLDRCERAAPGAALECPMPEAGGAAGGLWLGGFANVEARLATRWWLVAELNGYNVLAGDVPLRGGVLTGGLGVRFGF